MIKKETMNDERQPANLEQTMIKKATMNDELYYRTLGYAYSVPALRTSGGQSLILADIMACLEDCRSIYIPFNCPALEEECVDQGIHVVASDEQYDAVYWGTPTIVDDKVLFPDCLADPSDATKWNRMNERAASRTLTDGAVIAGAKRIITGLGTGDISVAERLLDMGGGRIVSWKMFKDFEDKVLVRNLV